VVGPKRNEIAMEKPKNTAPVGSACCNTNHFGIAGYYPLKALEEIDWLGDDQFTKLVAPLWG